MIAGIETKADKTELEAETSAREAADTQILETISAMSSGGMKFTAIEIAAGETYELEPNSLYFADPNSTNLNLLSASDNKIVSDNMGVAVIFCANTTDGTTWQGWCAWQSESVLKIADSLPYTFTKGAKIKNIHSTDNAYVYRLYMKGISSASVEGMGDISELKTSSKTLAGAINEVYNRTLDLYERVSELDIAINGGATVKPIDPIETPLEK
ncbi:MAG: hypothetical protein SOS24_03495 [Clostridia bacterium]|nr:hypothetical protein [Clostridia bacterium]